jgi:integrase
MGKRGQGEGTIRKRADGRWEAMITVPQDDGSTKRHSVYGKTQGEVRKKLTEARRTLDQGGTLITERQTVAAFLDRWLRDVVKPSVRPKTYDSYLQVVKLYIIPGVGAHQLTGLQPQHVQAMINARLAAGLSPRTVQYLRAILRRALGQALKWGLVARNVATLVDPPKSERREMRALSPDEAGRFLAAAQGDRLEALYRVALSIGLRQGEILGLRWEDVDLDGGRLAVRKQLQRIDGKPRLVDLKTRQSRRTISLPTTLTRALRAHRARQNEERLLLGEKWLGEGWGLVFTSTIGTPLDPRNLTDRYKKLLASADLPAIRFHDLRHSCASLLIAQGVPMEIVKETLGHSQISLTINTYVHLLPETQRQAADAIDRLFGTA